MAHALFDEELKTRVSPALKKRLEAAANKRQVKAAHIVREAIVTFLDKDETKAKRVTAK